MSMRMTWGLIGGGGGGEGVTAAAVAEKERG